MNQPRLTIGIPTLDRPELLKRAIKSALDQTTPAKILIADQGGSIGTAHVVAGFLKNDKAPLIHHIRTDASCVWENWQAAARSADTEFFAWLQDDDIVSRNYTRRITDAFDAFPEADTWIARLAMATGPDRAIWFAHNGPMVPFDLLNGRPCMVDGALFPPLTYFTSFALSPGAAFRCGEHFANALSRVPPRCDLFTERMILTAMGVQGPIICDPVLAGYWIQHEGNESKRQHDVQQDQAKAMADWADAAMKHCPAWRDCFEPWVKIMPTPHLMGFLQELSNVAFAGSEFVPQIRNVILKNLMENAVAVPAPPESIASIARDTWASVKVLGSRIRDITAREFKRVW